MSDRDYYEILGLTPRADGTMVDQAYWHLARKYQALAETNPRARAMLDELNAAYGVLGTPRLREQYDSFRDDMLLRAGGIQPAAAKPKHKTRTSAGGLNRLKKRRPEVEQAVRPRFAVAFPQVRVPDVDWTKHWIWYGTAAIAVALLGAGVWLSVSPLLVVGALCAVAALAFSRVLTRRLPAVSLTLPQITVPDFRAPRIDVTGARDLPKLRAPAGGDLKDDALDATKLRASTAAMVSRWRGSIGSGAAPHSEPVAATDEPSSTLVDIVRTEHELEDQDAPLAAVIDILRGSNRPVETK